MSFTRSYMLLATILVFAGSSSLRAADGLITLPSAHPADVTIERLEAQVQERGFLVFARLDHSAAAESVELKMPRATVIVFGNPRLGTPAFLETPTLAIDLPLKALVWENADGEVFLSYNSAEYVYGTIFARHGARYTPEAVARLDSALSAMANEAVK